MGKANRQKIKRQKERLAGDSAEISEKKEGPSGTTPKNFNITEVIKNFLISEINSSECLKSGCILSVMIFIYLGYCQTNGYQPYFLLVLAVGTVLAFYLCLAIRLKNMKLYPVFSTISIVLMTIAFVLLFLARGIPYNNLGGL